MRDFAKISCSIWNSRRFKSLPDDDARYLYFYLHTCPHVNSLGCFVLRTGYALSDLGWDADIETGLIRYRNGIEALSEAGLIGFDKDLSVIRIVDFLHHSPFANPKHAKGAMIALKDIPDCAQKQELLIEISGMKHVALEAISPQEDTVSIPYRNDTDIPETRERRRWWWWRGREDVS